MEDDLQWKTTSKYKKLNISATADWIFLKFETYSKGTIPKYKDTSKEDDLQWKTTSKYKRLNISATTDWIFLKF
jgi:hypothetical protein